MQNFGRRKIYEGEIGDVRNLYTLEETQELRRVVFRRLQRNVRNLGFHVGKNPA